MGSRVRLRQADASAVSATAISRGSPRFIFKMRRCGPTTATSPSILLPGEIEVFACEVGLVATKWGFALLVVNLEAPQFSALLLTVVCGLSAALVPLSIVLRLFARPLL